MATRPPSAQSVSLVMIARDEERCIGRALASVAPWVDEMVVVDTGSTDGTVDIAREHGARVEFFEWCDDFSAAKNAALEAARGEVRLVLDADEWLVSGGEHLREPLARGCAGRILLRNEMSESQAWTDARLTRVLPASARYEGRVHEQVTGVAKAVEFAVCVNHDGYLPEQNRRKCGRNERLLRRQLGEATVSDDLGYLHFQLGKDLEIQRRHEEAAHHYRESEALSRPEAPWRHELAARHLHCLGKAGHFDLARAHFARELPRWPESPDLYFVMADVLLDMAVARPRIAGATSPLIEACWRRCLEVGDRPDLEGTVHGRGSELAARNLRSWLDLHGRP